MRVFTPEKLGKSSALTPTGLSVATAILAACVALPSIAHAQTGEQGTSVQPEATADDGQTAGEIIVTARRRAESIHDVPQSIVAMTGAQLEETQVDSVDELSRVVPGLVFNETNPGGTGSPTYSLSLRGIGTTQSPIGMDATVGTVIDGVVMGYTNAFGQDFSDISRVEVLRGPQGTLFGKNSSGGVVSITTADPTTDFEASARIGYGTYEEVKIAGTVSGPLVRDELFGRVAFYDNTREGMLTDITSGEIRGSDHQQGVRVTFVLEPSDDTRFRLSLYQLERLYKYPGFDPVRALGSASGAGDFVTYGDIASTENDLLVIGEGSGDAFFETNFWGGIFQADQQLGGYTLTSISAFMDWTWDQEQFVAIPSVPGLTLNIIFPFTDQLWTQEFRLTSPIGSRFDYVAGLYYFQETHSTAQDITITFPPFIFIQRSYSDVETMNYAVFSEGNFHVTDDVTLIAGARWTHEEKDYFLEAIAPGPGELGFPPSNDPGITQDSVEAENWSWRFGAQWQPNDQNMFYAMVSRGFKGPGIDSAGQRGTTAVVDPEIATLYEVGWRTQSRNGRLTGDLTIFHTNFEDYQTTAGGFLLQPDGTPFTLPNGDPIAANYLQNAGSLISQGVEFAITAQATDALELTLRGAYLDAYYEEYEGAPCYFGQTAGCTATPTGLLQDLSGTQLPRAPEFSTFLGATYEFSQGPFPWETILHADYAWHSDIQFSTLNAPQGIEDGYGLLNASVEFRDPQSRVSFTVFGKNLTDQFHVSAINGAGEGTITHTLPSDYTTVWGATLNYRF